MAHRNLLKNVEDTNRNRFNEERRMANASVIQSLERTFFSNRNQYQEAKISQARLNDFVERNNKKLLTENQQRFQRIKKSQNRAKS